MNRIANNIKNRLSLRPPQAESLEILCKLGDVLSLKKNPDLEKELRKVNELYPTCRDFERNFPNLCFALATGVGKTRLMGAFIAYLYLAKGIKNFFVLAPNLTVYNKLIADFSNINSPKYVFQGIGELATQAPYIITGDNYDHRRLASHMFPFIVNIFNISKINAETRGGRAPKIKRLSEVLGESYFNYLANLDDLVLLMDESHHYRADRGMEVINELNPILGLELTATPQVERSGGAVKFKNVVYEYSLARAIRDGFVKEPAVATRKDFDPSHYSVEELDRLKLEDGIRIHEDTKVALEIYARDAKVKPVKPFVLVVAKDTGHAAKLRELIASNSFFNGQYADKVMEIHSNQTGAERDENIAQLLSLESPDNNIEIVIHVNMLKEGWDVTNLYTIIPLRTAASLTLREQTIGRGLRLPYGKRTGVDKVDKLTIVAHDKFQEIVDEANKPDSIIRLENIIELDPDDLSQSKEVISSHSRLEETISAERDRIENSNLNQDEKQSALFALEAKNQIIQTIPELNKEVKRFHDLNSEEIKKIVLEKVEERINQNPQQSLFKEQILHEAQKQYTFTLKEYAQNFIEIPRVVIQQSDEVKSGFHWFDLEVKNLNYQPVSEEILIKKLREQENSTDVISGKTGRIDDSLENILVNELINFPEIDYDDLRELLFHLVKQAIDKFQSYLTEDEMFNVVQYHKKEISTFIYRQMIDHFYCEPAEYKKPIVYPFAGIKEHNYSKILLDKLYHYSETITPTSAIPSKVFIGFKKAYHSKYKFDSKTEKDFANILENDSSVLKWLRPAKGQFSIYWQRNTQQYIPDFVVETADTIYMVETKKEGEIESSDVQEKTKAALLYCETVTEYNTANQGKPWKYVLVPHTAVFANMSFDTLMKRFEVKNEDL